MKPKHKKQSRNLKREYDHPYLVGIKKSQRIVTLEQERKAYNQSEEQ